MVLSDTSNGDIGWKKWVIAGWAVMECLLFGGLLYGWASVSFVLKMEGIYGCDLVTINGTIANDSLPANVSDDMSEVNDLICKQQDSNMALCFTIASSSAYVGCAVFGYVNYKFGTRVTRIISVAIFIIGSMMIAFTSKENPWLMYPGLACLSIAGLQILVTNAQVSNLFFVRSSTIVGLLSGAFDTSSVVMLIVKLVYQNGFSRQNIFIIIAILHVLVLVSTFGFLPKYYILRPGDNRDIQCEAHDEEEVCHAYDKNNEDTGEEQAASDVPSLRSCLLDPKFITHVIWICLLSLRFHYFIGTLDQYLTRILPHQDQVSYFLDVCMYTMMGGMLSSFLSGFVYDWQKAMCKDAESRTYRDVMPAVLPLVITSTLSLLLSILVLIPVTELLYVSFIVMTVYRSFLFSLAAAFLSAISIHRSSTTCQCGSFMFGSAIIYPSFIFVVFIMERRKKVQDQLIIVAVSGRRHIQSSRLEHFVVDTACLKPIKRNHFRSHVKKMDVTQGVCEWNRGPPCFCRINCMYNWKIPLSIYELSTSLKVLAG